MKQDINIERLWKRLFGARDEATFRDFTDESFEEIVKFLEKITTSIEWEIDRASRKIIIWKPKEDLKGAMDFLLLLSMIQSRERRRQNEIRRSNSNNSKSKE